jgi:hypothetical protein
VTTAKRPSRSGTGHGQDIINFEKAKEQNFDGKDWTSVIALKILTKKARWRSELSPVPGQSKEYSRGHAILAGPSDLPDGLPLVRIQTW